MTSLHIVHILVSNGFPNGMAATQRVRLLSKAMLLKGHRVTILCIRALERAPIENMKVRGCYQGIEFEYTPGTTIRAKSFIKRRWLEAWGLLVSILRLFQFKKSGTVNCIYLWGATGKLTFTGCFYRGLAKILGIPLLVELNERPWSLQTKLPYLEKKVSPLSGVTGVIVISSLLRDWVQAEADRISKKVEILYVPILVDPQEVGASYPPVHQAEPFLVFAAAPQYGETIRFLLEAMKLVVKKHPLCQLKITGVRNTDSTGTWLRSDQNSKNLRQNIQLMGYIPRSELLTLFRQSYALLIPLFNDVTSLARFPTKLGEYLCSGRPVITNEIGELTKYLVDDDSAFLCDRTDSAAYAETICRALDDPAHAAEVGLRGKEVARSRFDYALWAGALSSFLTSLGNQSN
jgi:glycosyltransferase involved in cell wall biosynthesis